eukprot:787251-Alexandrium_andersonii.AAC.1
MLSGATVASIGCPALPQLLAAARTPAPAWMARRFRAGRSYLRQQRAEGCSCWRACRAELKGQRLR